MIIARKLKQLSGNVKVEKLKKETIIRAFYVEVRINSSMFTIVIMMGGFTIGNILMIHWLHFVKIVMRKSIPYPLIKIQL